MEKKADGPPQLHPSRGQTFNNPTPALAGLHWKRQRAASCSFKMISFANINKQYGKQLLLVDASFQLNPGEKVGLVGPNGAGKTTLFQMVVGEETPDESAVFVPQEVDDRLPSPGRRGDAAPFGPR